MVYGYPQGSNLGSFIWNLVMDQLFGDLNSKDQCVVYSADFIIHDEYPLLEGTEYMRILNAWYFKVGAADSTEKP